MTTETINLNKEQMNVVFVGHVDHGKSTVIGRMLADTNSLPKGKMEQIEERCKKSGKPFEYAFLIDALKDEQAQSITIDSARVFFQSEKRDYIIIDAPGHIEFIKNMVTGASHAEAAILVIDANEGVQENSRRHGYLLWMLGIKKIVVVVNKMDLVNYQQSIFEQIRTEYNDYLAGIGVEPLFYIPVSGREGDNIVHKSKNMPWWDGLTALEALDSFTKAAPLTHQPLRIPIQDVYKFSSFGDSRRIIAGTISSGSINVDDELVIYPSGKRTSVASIEAFNSDPKTKAIAGESTGFTMKDQIYTHRGEIVSKLGETPPFVSTRLKVSLFWLGRQPLSTSKSIFLKLGTVKERAQIETIHQVIDASDYANVNGKTEINHHDVAEVTFKLAHPIAFDTSDKLPDTSRFVIVDDYEIRGGGIVIEALPDEETQLREDVFLRNQKWIHSTVTMEDRAEHYNQKSALVIITGEKGTGRKRLASQLEKLLFDSGKLAYYMGIGSLLYGVNADLKRHQSPDDWKEHVRRFAEVAHLFLDAGMIMIVTAVELTQADLNIIKTVIDEEKIETVWLGKALTTDIQYDLIFHHGETHEEAVCSIKELLQDDGVIFKI